MVRSINDTGSLGQHDSPPDLFAFKINYDDNSDDNDQGELVQHLYNGNISETFWRTANDDKLRKYGYTMMH